MAIETDRIASHLAGRGELCGYSLRGYIPCYTNDDRKKYVFYYGTDSVCGYIMADADSGVLIGAGFDLGRYRKQDLKYMEVPDELLKILSYYTAHSGGEAMRYLRNRPLTLSPGAVMTLTRIMVGEFCRNELAPVWNDAGEYKRFATMSWQEQAVIFDVAHELGMYEFQGHIKQFADFLYRKDYAGLLGLLDRRKHEL